MSLYSQKDLCSGWASSTVLLIACPPWSGSNDFVFLKFQSFFIALFLSCIHLYFQAPPEKISSQILHSVCLHFSFSCDVPFSNDYKIKFRSFSWTPDLNYQPVTWYIYLYISRALLMQPVSTCLNLPFLSSSECLLSPFSRVQVFATPWTLTHQAPLSMGFSRQEYWSGLPFLPPGHLPEPGLKSTSHVSCIGRWVFTTSATWG